MMNRDLPLRRFTVQALALRKQVPGYLLFIEAYYTSGARDRELSILQC